MKASSRWIKIWCAVLIVVGQLISVAGYTAESSSTQSLVLFPVAASRGIEASRLEYVEQHARDLFVLLSEGLTAAEKLSLVTFDPRSASVERAVREQKFAEKELAAPIDTTSTGAAKARKLAVLMGAEIAVITSLDRYRFDEDKGEVELTVTLQVLDVDNGRILSATTATGRAERPEGDTSQTELSLGVAATYEVAEKLLGEIADLHLTQRLEYASGMSAVPEIRNEQKRKGGLGLIPAVIGALLLGFVISSS